RSARIEPEDRDSTPLGFGDDGAGRGTIGEPLGDPDHIVFDFPDEIEIRFRIIDEMVEDPNSQFSGRESDVLLLMLIDDVVDAALSGPARLAARNLAACEVLQLEGNVFEHVSHPR